MNSASWIGADFGGLAAITAIHHDGLRHLVARLLDSRLFGRAAVRLGLLDLQSHNDCALMVRFAGVPHRGNLHKFWLVLPCLGKVSVYHSAKTI
jgi:hypothetical protein